MLTLIQALASSNSSASRVVLPHCVVAGRRIDNSKSSSVIIETEERDSFGALDTLDHCLASTAGQESRRGDTDFELVRHCRECWFTSELA